MSDDPTPDPTRPTIFVEFTQAEAHGLLEALAEGERRMGRPVAVVRAAIAKIHEAQTDDDIRSVLLEDAIIDRDYDPEADRYV